MPTARQRWRTVAAGGGEGRDAHALAGLQQGGLLQAGVHCQQVGHVGAEDGGNAKHKVALLDCRRAGQGSRRGGRMSEDAVSS